MSFFYDLNKKLDSIRATPEVTHKQLNERANSPVKDVEESAFQAAIGKKKYGDEGMKALQKAGRDNASAKTMNTIRNKYDKYDESGGPSAVKSTKPAPAKPSKPAPKGEFMGTIKGGVWTADPPKPGERGVPAPSGDPEGVREGSKKLNFADKIANAKKEVDEMLGDVAAEAMRSALSPKQKKMAALGGDPERIDARDLAALRKGADMGEDNAFDYKTPRSMNKGEKKTSSTGGEIYQKDNKTVVHTAGRHYGGGDEPDPKREKQSRSGAPKKSDKPRQERMTANSRKTDRTAHGQAGFAKEKKIKEGEVDIRDQGEYDQEGDMAKNDIKTIVRHAQALSRVLGDNDNLPEWVQSKLAKIEGMMISVDEYMQNQRGEDEEAIAEEPRSKNQAVAARIARGVQKGTAKAKPGSASAEMAKMRPKELNKFAKGSTKGLPKTVSKNKAVGEADENSDDGKLITKQTGSGQSLTTSTTGRVSATLDKGKMSVKPGKSTDDDADTASVSNKDTSPSKSNSMVGKGIYDSMNRELENMIAESMSINMSDSTEGGKSLTVTATDEDAMKLAVMLKSAGLGGQGRELQSDESCSTCGMPDCGCGDVQEAVDENSPDWPTNTETSPDALQYAGGLNKPKTDVAGDGQTTIPNTAVHTQDEDDLQRIREMAGIKIRNPLGPTSSKIASMSKDEVNAALRSGMSPDIAAMSKDEVNSALRSGMSPDISDMNPDSANAEFGKDSIQRMREMAGIKEAEKTEEGNLFTAGLEDDDVKIGDKIPGTNAIKKKDIDESIFALTNQWRAYKG